jgi:hypothetical protein
LSGKFVDGGGLLRLRQGGKKLLNSPDGIGIEENISAYIALLGGDVIDDDDATVKPDGVVDERRLVGTGATLDRALHGRVLRWVGVTHFGGLGR